MPAAAFTTRAACATVAGALLATGWLWPGWVWPGWAALIGILVLTRFDRATSALGWCWLLGLVGHVVGFYWVPETVERFSKLPGWLADLAFLAGASLGALQFGVFGGLVCWLRQCGRASPVIVAAMWAAFELLWPAVFPWRLGQTQVEWPALVQIAEITGVCGISFLMTWMSELACVVVEQRWRRRSVPSIRPVVGQCVLALAVLAGTLLFGVWRERDLRAHLRASTPLRVGLVQCSDDLGQKTANLQRLSKEIGDQVDLLCWPESAAAGIAAQHEQLPAVSRPYDGRRCFLLTGCSVRSAPESADRLWFNSAILVDPQDRIIGRYDKRVLIPFGEHVPGEDWFPALRDLTVFEQRFRAGESAAPLAVPSDRTGTPDRAHLGVLICYEDVLSGLARASTAAGADLLVNLTNDRWFGNSHALPQHQQLARFRAIENRRYLLRCTMTGSTSIIDPLGVVVAQAPLQHPATIVHTVATLNLRTFYTAWGDVFGWGCVVVLGLAVISARRSAGISNSPEGRGPQIVPRAEGRGPSESNRSKQG